MTLAPLAKLVPLPCQPMKENRLAESYLLAVCMMDTQLCPVTQTFSTEHMSAIKCCINLVLLSKWYSSEHNYQDDPRIKSVV